MFIKKVIIENFQSHEYTELDFPPGLTIIVGESDRGKSAIVRALRWVFENEPSGTDFIRAGARKCRVTVETDQGVAVIRERTPSRNRYIVRPADGTEETFEGFRNEIPEEVINAHGVTKVRLDSDLEVSLNIAPQLDGPFLLSSPGSVKAKAIGCLYKVHKIDAAVRDTTQDINKLTKEEAQIDSQLKDLEQKLQEFDNLPDIKHRLNKANLLMNSVMQSINRKIGIEQIKLKLHEINKEKNYNKNVLNNLADLNKGLDLYEAVGKLKIHKVKLKELSLSLKFTRDKLDSVRITLGATTGIDKGFSQYENLLKKNNNITDLIHLRTKMSKINWDIKSQKVIIQETDRVPDGAKNVQLLTDAFDAYFHIVNIGDKLNILRNEQKNYRLAAEHTEKIELSIVNFELIRKLEQKYLKLVTISNMITILRQTMTGERILLTKTSQIPVGLEKHDNLTMLLRQLEELTKLSLQYKKLLKRISNGHEFLQEREREILTAANNYGLMLKKLGECPTCFSKIDKNTVERIVSLV